MPSVTVPFNCLVLNLVSLLLTQPQCVAPYHSTVLLISLPRKPGDLIPREGLHWPRSLAGTRPLRQVE